MTDDLERAAQALEDWAQNEEMIDGHFLQHGRDCNEAAAMLRGLLARLEEAQGSAVYLREYIGELDWPFPWEAQ